MKIVEKNIYATRKKTKKKCY